MDQKETIIQCRRSWNDFEDKAILTLVKKYGTKNWAEISEKMSSKYGIDTRTGKQCRQRWHNHLNPQVNKNAWTSKQEKIMFEAHQKHGNKWTQIAKLFEGRTDNDIKNHFYSMLRRSLRRVNKLLGMRNSTKKIRLIKPSVLSKIFANNKSGSSDETEDWKKISQALFQFSKSKSTSVDDISNNLEEEEKRRLQDFIQRIAVYNQEYEENQLLKKASKKSSMLQQQKQSQQQHIFKKISSNHSIGSNKSNKTKKIKRGLKKQKSDQSVRVEKGLQKKQVRKSKRNELIRLQEHSGRKPRQTSKLSKNNTKQSQFSVNIEDNFNLPDDLFQLPQINNLAAKRSSYRESKRGSSSSSPSFFINSNSPRMMDLRIFTRTPQGPTPMADVFSKNLFSYEWKDNNEDLDSILSKTRQAIEKKTNRP